MSPTTIAGRPQERIQLDIIYTQGVSNEIYEQETRIKLLFNLRP